MSATALPGPALDKLRLNEALGLAQQAIGVSEPNPRVGCVLATADGTVVGRGHTQRIGGPHAEVMALRDAQARGADVAGGTAWVTLEPCAHHGRTPPCCDALIAAGLARVVVACGDPFPGVAGQGIARMRAAGIAVEMADAETAQAARALNIGFHSRIERGRPWVRLKLACSIDGFTALPDGRSQWITGPEARADGHRWRQRAGAVLTGIGTVLADDPRLDVRAVPTVVQPLRVVLDSNGRLPDTARVHQPPGELLVVGCQSRPGTLCLPGAEGRVDLDAVLQHLTERGVNELHVEAGVTLSGAWLATGLVDEILLYMAPRFLVSGQGLVKGLAPDTLAPDAPWALHEVAPVGEDLRLRLLPRVSDFLTTAEPRASGTPV